MDYIAENITVETTEVKFNINVETQAAESALKAKKYAEQSAQILTDVNTAGSNALTYINTAKDRAIAEIQPLVDGVTGKAQQVSEDATQVDTDKGLVDAFKTQAESAASEIKDKIDFSALQEGDLLRHDGTKLVRVSETALRPFTNAQLWDRSPIDGKTIAPSGQIYSVVDGFKTISMSPTNNNYANLSIDFIQNKPISHGTYISFRAFVDTWNWYEIKISSRSIVVNQSVGGVVSEIYNNNSLLSDTVTRFYYRPMYLVFYLGTYSASQITAIPESQKANNLPIMPFPAKQFKYFGWKGNDIFEISELLIRPILVSI